MNNKGALIFFLLLFILLTPITLKARAQDADRLVNNGKKVREAIQVKHTLPDLSANGVRESAKLDINKAFQGKYTLGISYELAASPGKYVALHMDWNTENKNHADQIRLVVVTGENVSSNALTGLLEIMGSGTTMAITPSSFEVLKNGPGNIAFVMPVSLKTDENGLRIIGSIWFCRDNIAVQVSCSGNTDLLPIAKAIDQAIQSCPVKESKDKKSDETLSK